MPTSARNATGRAKPFKEASLLVEKGFPRGAAARAYYAVFHVARALVLLKGSETRKHGGVASALHLHYVKTGILEAEMGRRYAFLQNFREDADYRVLKDVDADAARDAVDDARRFLLRCEELLRALAP